MKPMLISGTIGLLLGCLLSFAVLSRRYTIVPVVANSSSRYVVRLDTWTGKMYVLSMGSGATGAIDENDPANQ